MFKKRLRLNFLNSESSNVVDNRKIIIILDYHLDFNNALRSSDRNKS